SDLGLTAGHGRGPQVSCNAPIPAPDPPIGVRAGREPFSRAQRQPDPGRIPCPCDRVHAKVPLCSGTELLYFGWPFGISFLLRRAVAGVFLERPPGDDAMEPLNDVLRRMSDLVRERPGVTVREIARELGYTQERSVYYWLNKADFQGIRQFRDAVLRGELAPRGKEQGVPAGHSVPLYRMTQIP